MKAFENEFGEVFEVFFVLGKNENVVYVYDAKSLFDFILEGVVHHCLKCQRGILECCFPLVAILDVYVVESPSNIEFDEVFHSRGLDLVHDFRYK